MYSRTVFAIQKAVRVGREENMKRLYDDGMTGIVGEETSVKVRHVPCSTVRVRTNHTYVQHVSAAGKTWMACHDHC